MLAYDQESALQSLRSRRLDILMIEMEHYTNNLSQISGQAAILAGFSFSALTAAPIDQSFKGTTVPTIYAGSDHICELFYIYCTIMSMMFNVIALCVATFASMLGPDLGLRGPAGSMEVATRNLRLMHSWVASAYIAGLYFFMSAIIGWSWTYFYLNGQGTLHEPLGITIVVVLMGMMVTGWSVRVMYDLFYHANQLPLGPFQIGSKANANSTAVDNTVDLTAQPGSSRGAFGNNKNLDSCCNCGSELQRGTQFCFQCGTRHTFKSGVATRGYTAKGKAGREPAFFEVVSGFVRRLQDEGGSVQAEIALTSLHADPQQRVTVTRSDDPSNANSGNGQGLTVLVRSEGETGGGELSILCASGAEAEAWKLAVLEAVQQGEGTSGAGGGSTAREVELMRMQQQREEQEESRDSSSMASGMTKLRKSVTGTVTQGVAPITNRIFGQVV